MLAPSVLHQAQLTYRRVMSIRSSSHYPDFPSFRRAGCDLKPLGAYKDPLFHYPTLVRSLPSDAGILTRLLVFLDPLMMWP